MKTTTVIKKYSSGLQKVLTEGEVHSARVAQVIGVEDRTIPSSVREKLYDSDFVWMVEEVFVRKFKHAASIQRGVVFESDDHKNYPSLYPIKSIRYVGDLPDFVMDRMKTAEGCGLSFFTVHSTNPLPVEVVFEKVDPVMIGWYHNPGIVFMGNLWGQKRFHHMSPTAQGVVVAIWDKDKELDII